MRGRKLQIMAFVLKPVIKVEILGYDESKPTRTEFHIGAVAGVLPALDDVQAAISTAAANVQLTSDCVVSGWNATYSAFQDTIPAFGAAPDRERKGVLQYNTADGFFSQISLFGAKYSMFAPDGVQIIRDPADDQSFTTNPLATPLNALNTLFLNGLTVGLVTYPIVDRRSADLVSLADAYKQTKSNSRG